MSNKNISTSLYIIIVSAMVLIFNGIGPAQAKSDAKSGGNDDTPLDHSPMFNEIDTDRNGKATSDEWDAAGMPKIMFQIIDINKDSHVTLEELNASSPPAAVDKDKDGLVTLAELKDFIASMPSQGASDGAVITAPSGGEMPPSIFVANSPHVGDGPTGRAFIDAMDTNKDGKIDHDEWEINKRNTVYKNKRWPNYNKNMDNYITLDEAPQEGVNWEEAPSN